MSNANHYQISRQKSISIVTMRIYFYKGFTTGIPFNSWKNEIHKLSGKVQHDVAWDETIKLATEKFAGKFKRALMFDNFHNVQIYQNDGGNVIQRCNAYFENNAAGKTLALIKYDHFIKDTNGKVVGEQARSLEFTKQQMVDHSNRNIQLRFELLSELNMNKVQPSNKPAAMQPNMAAGQFESATLQQLSELSKKYASR